MSRVTQFFKETYPALGNVPDEKLTQFIGDSYPQFLNRDEQFRTEYIQGSPSFKPVEAEEDLAPDPTVKTDSSADTFRQSVMGDPVLKEWAEAWAGDDLEAGAREIKRKLDFTTKAIEVIDNKAKAFKMLSGDDPVKLAAVEQFRTEALESIGVVVPEELSGKITAGRLTPGLVSETTGAGEKTAKTVSGVQNAVLDALSFFNTPIGVATLGMGAFPAAMQRLIAGGFAVQMGKHMPEQLVALAEAYKKGDLENAVRFGTGAVLTGVFTAKAAGHAVGKTKAGVLDEQLKESAKFIEEAVKSPEVNEVLSKLAEQEAVRVSLPEQTAVEKARPAPMDKKVEATLPRPVSPVQPELFSKAEQEMESGEVGTPMPEAPGRGKMPSAEIVTREMEFSAERQVKGKASTQDVLDQIGSLIKVAGADVPIRRGRFFNKALGIFKPKEDVIRTLDLSDIPTALHEAGHALHKYMYGAGGPALRGKLPRAVRDELHAIGRELYGKRKPAWGYTAEGWAEYIRKYFSTDDYDAVAPATTKHWEDALSKNQTLARAVRATRTKLDMFRLQGYESFFKESTGRRPVGVAKLAGNVKETFWDNFIFNWIEMFEPIRQISERAQTRVKEYPELARELGITDREGNLSPYADPFLIASWKRGSSGTVLRAMFERGMQDIWGRPTGGKPLRDSLSLVRWRRRAFGEYVTALRVKEVWEKTGKNPGLPLKVAQGLIDKYRSPKFDLAVNEIQEFWEGILRYVEQANPAFKPLFDKWRKQYNFYMPLTKIIDPKAQRLAYSSQRGNPFFRLTGKGGHLRIQDVFESMIDNAAYLIGKTHKAMVEQALIKLAKLPEMGKFLEGPLPKDKVRQSVSIDKIRDQLEQAGIDTVDLPESTLLEWFDVAKSPTGNDPIITTLNPKGEIEWYQLKDPIAFEALNGIEMAPLNWAADLFLGMPTRAFRLGTTGLRAGFAFTNMRRDYQTWLLQTVTHSNVPKMTATYFGSLSEVIKESLAGKHGPYTELFHRLGVSMGQPLGLDRAETRRASRELFKGKAMRVLTNPIEHMRDVLSIPEAAPRVAEMKLLAEEVGYRPGTPITPDQAVILGVAGKRATVDFSAGGKYGRRINQMVPFFNPAVQGLRSFSRSLGSKDPALRAQTILRGLTLLTLPTLLNWWRNKDEDWYRNLPYRERYLYTHVNDGERVWRIPRPFEWGNVFQVIPEALVDAWWQDDPESLTAAMGHVFETTNPASLPVLARIADEQFNNIIRFWDRPIVPKSELEAGILPGEQIGPYTSSLAEAIGAAFPNYVSPRRLDAGIRSYFGGAVPDLLAWIDSVSGREKIKRDFEPSDIPVIGNMFRRGGEFSAQSKFINEYWERWEGLRSRSKSKMQALTEEEFGYFKTLDAWKRLYFVPLSKMASQLEEKDKRSAIYRKMSEKAKWLMEQDPQNR